MENEKLIKQIQNLKEELKKDGFVIDGVFGSLLRSQNYNDIDLLYHLEDEFFIKNRGFKGFQKLNEIKILLQKKLGKDIDLAPIDNLSNTAKKHILKEVIYV